MPSQRYTETLSPQAIAGLASELSAELRRGTIRLRDIVGLSDAEMAAVEQQAIGLGQRGKLQQSVAVYGLLLVHDLLTSRYWQAMGLLQQKLGQAAVALACFQAAELLGRDDPARKKQEAICLEQLGAADLAAETMASLAN